MALDPLTAGIELLKTGLKRFLPEKMSEADEAEFNATIENSFRSFTIQYEGAMKDYKDVPFIGPVVLLFRGLIRPVFTCLVGYLDYNFIMGTGYTQAQAELIKAMTLIVLFFWFGERAVKNSGMMDAISKFFRRD